MYEMDITQEGQELARRRKIQEAMLAQAMKSGERASSGQGNVLDALGSWLGNRRANAQGQELQAAEQAYRQKYDTQLQAGLSNYLDKRNGRPGEVLDAGAADALMNGEQDPGMLRAGVKADPRRAVVEAMTSQLPELQAIGKADFGQLGKGQEITEHIVNGQLVAGPKGGAKTAVFGTPPAKDGYGPLEVVGRDAKGAPLQAQKNLSTGKYEYAPGGGQQINVNNNIAGQKEGLAEWSKLAAKTVGDLSETARNSNKMITQLQQLEANSNSGTFNGPTANPAIWMGQLARSAGIPVSADTSRRLQNSETFGNTAAELWLSSMNANGGSRGLVKEESERIAQNLPSLIQSPEGRKQIIAVMRQVAQQNIEDAQVAQSEYSSALRTQDPAKFTFGLGATMLPNTMPNTPAPGSVTQGGKPTVSNW